MAASFECPICKEQYEYEASGNKSAIIKSEFMLGGGHKKETIIMDITRGCKFNCTRCNNPFEIKSVDSNKKVQVHTTKRNGGKLVYNLNYDDFEYEQIRFGRQFKYDNRQTTENVLGEGSYKYSQRHKEMKKMKKLFKKYFKVLPREKRKDIKIASWYQSVVDTDDYMLLARSLNWLTKQLDDNGYGNGVTDDHSTFMTGLGMSASNNKIENAIELGLVKKEIVANAMKGDKTAEKQVAQAMRTAEELGFIKDSSRAKEYESLNDSQKKKFLESWDNSSLKSQKAKDKYEKDKKKFEDDEEALYKQYEASNSRKTKWDDRTRKLKEKLGVDKLEGIIGEYVNSNEYSTKDNSYIYNGKDWDVWSNADKKRGYRELDEKDIENNPVKEYYNVALKS